MNTEELSLGQVVEIAAGLGRVEAKRQQGQNWVVDIRLEDGTLSSGVNVNQINKASWDGRESLKPWQ